MVKYFKNPEYNQIATRVLIFIGLIILNRISNWFMLGIALYGISATTSKKVGKALVIFMLLSFFPMVNPMLMPRYGQFAVIARITSMIMSISLIVGGSTRNGNHSIPLLSIFGYLFVSAISSAFGYFPLISYLKIVNFIFFILALYYGTRNIHLNPEDLKELRYSFLALTALLVYGSLLTLPFPSIAYFTSLSQALQYGGISYANWVYAAGGKNLFCGITVHSQFLGPLVGCCFGWVLCDLWIVEKKLSKLHMALLAPIPVIAFMTRSRLAFVVLVVAVLGNALYCLPKIRVSQKLKSAFSKMMAVGLIAMIVGGVVGEVKSSAISRWLRKNDNLSEDTRSLGSAMTDSRQKLIAESMSDFRKNVFMGKGFQVTEDMPFRYKSGRVTLFSASVEKGVLPVMILGEAGIAGAIAFIVFLSAFFIGCNRKKYIATPMLFLIYLSTNIAEATFFSPSGGGGVEWVYLLVGGFAIDMSTVAENKRIIKSRESLVNKTPKNVGGDDKKEKSEVGTLVVRGNV